MANNDNRAREGDLADLHGMFAKFLSTKLKAGEVTGPELNCIRQFLKDNGIDCVGQANADVNDIVANLPTFDNDSDDETMILN